MVAHVLKDTALILLDLGLEELVPWQVVVSKIVLKHKEGRV